MDLRNEDDYLMALALTHKIAFNVVKIYRPITEEPYGAMYTYIRADGNIKSFICGPKFVTYAKAHTFVANKQKEADTTWNNHNGK